MGRAKKTESDVTREEFEDLADKVDELQLYKFPNATIVGEPTINNGQISGFSQNNYLRFPFLVDFKNKPFVIDIEFTTGANVTNQENIFDSDFGLAFAIRNARFVFAVSSNGTSWNIGEGVGTYTVLANTTYRVRLAWDGSNYTLAYSLDGGKTYITDITKAAAQQPYPKQIFIGVGQSDVTVLNAFSGVINLNQAYLHIEDKLIWQGMDDVGLATRLSVDLDNLDPDGENKINDISEEKLVSQTVKKIHLYDDFEILSNGTDLPRLHWSDGEVIFGGDYVEIHSVAGEESRARFGDGIIKLEGSPYNAKNATYEMGLDGNGKTYFDLKGDSLKFNNSDIATIDALQPIWISNLMTTDLELDIVSDDELKLLSRQIVYIMKNYNFMVLKMYIDDGNETLVRNKATSPSSGDGSIVCPIYTDVMGRYRKVEEYMLLGDDVHEILLSFLLDLSTNVLHFTIGPCYNEGARISWAYNTQYDAVINQTFTFDYVSFSKMAGLIPYTGDKTIVVN